MELTIVFHDKKTYNKFLRNLRNGKGTVLNSNNISLSETEGDGFGNILRRASQSKAAKSLAKTLGQKAIEKASDYVEKKTGSKLASQLTNDALNSGLSEYTGEGFLKNVAKRLVKKAAPHVGKAAAKYVADKTGSDLAGVLANEAVVMGSEKIGKGKGGSFKALGGSFMPSGGKLDRNPVIKMDLGVGNRPGTMDNPSFDPKREAMLARMAKARAARKKK